MRYNSQWTAGLSNPDKMLFNELLGTNNKVLDRLAEICYNMVKSSEVGDTDFENPNWAMKQAHWLGYRKAMRHIAGLCTPSDNLD